MAESTPYFDGITAARALLLTDQEALEGQTLLSAESDPRKKEDQRTLTYIQENFPMFLKILRLLKKEDQELLLSYYTISKTQNTLAIIHRSTQTVCSFRIRMAVKVLCAFILFDGEVTEEKMHKVLALAGLEDSIKGVPLSTIIDLYIKTRSFQRVAEIHKLHRPHIRRAMSRASKQLLESRNPEEKALGAFIYSVIDKANPSGTGYSKRKVQKLGNIMRVDSPILGDFRIKITDPDFDELFVSRANRG
jgi:hypothetical protein